jgi:hypothetical protein
MTWAPMGNVRSLEKKKDKGDSDEEKKKKEDQEKKKKKLSVKRPKITWPQEAEIMRRAVTIQVLSKMFAGSNSDDQDIKKKSLEARRKIFQDFVGEEQFLSHKSWTRFEKIRAGPSIMSKKTNRDQDDDEEEVTSWSFEDDTKWTEYSKRDAEKLTRGMERGDKVVKISNRYGDYDVVLPLKDEEYGEQTNTRTNKTRRVRVSRPKKQNTTNASQDEKAIVVVSASQPVPTGMNFEVTMHIADWKKHGWIGLYKVGQLDEVIEFRACSIGKSKKKKKKKKSYDDDYNSDYDYGSQSNNDDDNKKAENDHSDDPMICVVFDKSLGAWDTSAKYELRYFDAGWDLKKNKLRFVPSRGPVLTSDTFTFSGVVDSSVVKPEPKPRPQPAENKLASSRKERSKRYSWDRNRSSAWSGGGLPGAGGVGREVKNGLYRNRTRVKIKFKNKWYEGVFVKSNASKRPTQPYAVQCDCDKKGVLTWGSLDAIEILPRDDDDDDDNNSGDKETAGGSAWNVEI